MKRLLPLRRALEDEHLFGNEVAGDSWAAMKAIVLAALGEALTEDERAYFQKLTKLDQESLQRAKRLVIIAGRRSGKSKSAAILAIYLAVLCDHRENLTTGEKGVVLCIAQNQEQAKIVFGYVKGIVKSIPTIAKEVVNVTALSITFKNGIEIQVRPASFRGLRGVTCIAAICDEMAFWFTEENNSTNPDSEIVNALKPALVTTKGMLIIISSPYARRGVVWKYYSAYFGKEGSPVYASDVRVARSAALFRFSPAWAAFPSGARRICMSQSAVRFDREGSRWRQESLKKNNDQYEISIEVDGQLCYYVKVEGRRIEKG
jgi:hypothetical protein